MNTFSWRTRSAPITAKLRVFDVTASGPLASLPAGIEVASCTDGMRGIDKVPAGDEGCTWSGVHTDDYGTASIKIPAAPSGASVIVGLRGENQRIYLPPMIDSGAFSFPITKTSLLGFLSDYCCALKYPYDPNLGAVWFNAFDCLGEPAVVSVVLTLPGQPDRTLGTCEADTYVNGPGSSDCTARMGKSGLFYNVTPSEVVGITATIPDSMPPRTVSQRTLLVGGGWMSTVFLYPLASDEASQ
jgi:hypothetical protein